jgi:hypothetical protein
MRQIALLSTLVIFTLSAGAQVPETTTEPRVDSTKIKIGNSKFIIVSEGEEKADTTIAWTEEDLREERATNRQRLTYWSGVDVGFSMLRTADGGTTMRGDNDWLDLDYSRSLIWRFNIIEEKINLIAREGKPILGLVVGAGFTYASYGLSKNTRVVSNTNAFPDTTFGFADTSLAYSYSKNKMRMSYIQVPLLLEVNTSTDPDRNFHIAAGAIVGWNMGTVIKHKYDVEGRTHKDRTKGDFNTQPFTLDLTARMGYRNFGVWASYSLTPLFEDGRGPEVYPMSFGVSFTFGEDA